MIIRSEILRPSNLLVFNLLCFDISDPKDDMVKHLMV